MEARDQSLLSFLRCSPHCLFEIESVHWPEAHWELHWSGYASLSTSSILQTVDRKYRRGYLPWDCEESVKDRAIRKNTKEAFRREQLGEGEKDQTDRDHWPTDSLVASLWTWESGLEPQNLNLKVYYVKAHVLSLCSGGRDRMIPWSSCPACIDKSMISRSMNRLYLK